MWFLNSISKSQANTEQCELNKMCSQGRTLKAAFASTKAEKKRKKNPNKSETRMTANILKQDPNTPKVKKNANLI